MSNDMISSVIDAFNEIVSDNSEAVLGTKWDREGSHKTRNEGVISKTVRGGTYSASSNQDGSENSWNSWANNNSSSRENNNASSWDNNNDSSWGNNDNNNSWGNEWGNGNSNSNSGWGNEDDYSTNNSEYQNSSYTSNRGSYQDVNKTVDATRMSTYSYTDNNNTGGPNQNQINNVDMYTNNNINDFNKSQQEYDHDGWSQAPYPPYPSQQQQQQNSYNEPQIPSPSESDDTTNQNSETTDPDDIKLKLSAWHSLVDPNAKERDDGIGGGQLHRSGRNYIPVAEAKLLAMQEKSGHRRGRKGPEKLLPKSNVQSPAGKSLPKLPQKLAAPSKQTVEKHTNAKTIVSKIPQVQQTSSNSQIQQASKKPSPPPSQSSQRQPTRDDPQPSRDAPHDSPQPSRDPPQSSRDPPQPPRDPPRDHQQPSRPQQPKQSQNQQSQNQQPQHSWNTQLVNEPFWDEPAASPPLSPPPTVQKVQNQYPLTKQHADEVISNQSQPPRHQSPARSPRSSRPVQDYNLPFIPPEFDSTPYRKQSSPSSAHNTADRYNESVLSAREDFYKNQRNEYYGRSDAKRENKFDHNDDRRKEPEKKQAPYAERHDRGELLLTINVELEEGKTQSIRVHANDRPIDLAKDFCDKWKFKDEQIMPALELLIKEEKEKRIAINVNG